MEKSLANIKIELSALEIPQSTLAYVAGIQPAKLARAINGVQVLSKAEESQVQEAFEQLKHVVEHAKPFKLDVSEAGASALRDIINSLKDGDVVAYVPAFRNDQAL